MDCCGPPLAFGNHLPLRGAALAPVATMLAGEAGPPGSTEAARAAGTADAAVAVLRRSISVDVHSHGGRTGITSKAPPSDDLATAMRAGSSRRIAR
jgi:membrane dipeptidase